MRRHGICSFLTFLAGGLVALLVGGVAGSLAATRYADLALFTSALDLVRQYYFEPIEDRKLLHGAVRGLIQQLDPHSSFLEADAFEETWGDTRGEFYGLGIEITKRRDGPIEVIAPIEGTPAARAGIRARDRIASICPTEPPESWTEECRSTADMTFFQAVKLLRGPRGSKIAIEVLRPGLELPQRHTLVRELVQVVSVEGRMLEPAYAYVRLRVFQQRTSGELKRVLEELHDEAAGGLEGLVLDLRDNPRGLLDQAVEVADAWLAEDLVVYTQGHVEAQRKEFRAHAHGTELRYPIAVLVNEGTASSSEIVAGALQDQHRALLVGTKTFGKGSVQTVYPLEGGRGLRLTTAHYYTPSGRSIRGVGITPDIAVDAAPASAAAQDPTAPRGRGHERRAEGDSAREGADAQVTEEGEDPEAQPLGETDVQLDRALEVLKSGTAFARLKRREAARDRAALPGGR